MTTYDLNRFQASTILIGPPSYNAPNGEDVDESAPSVNHRVGRVYDAIFSYQRPETNRNTYGYRLAAAAKDRSRVHLEPLSYDSVLGYTSLPCMGDSIGLSGVISGVNDAFAYVATGANGGHLVCSFFSYEPAALKGYGLNRISDNSATFRILRDKWRQERGFTSSITKMVMCYSYQRIIGMGPSAIPLILRELEEEGDEPDMWFWALNVLTGENPVSQTLSGDMVAMAGAWLKWARPRYVW